MILYAGFLAYLGFLAHANPEKFAHVIGGVPGSSTFGPLMLPIALPLKPIMLVARSGALRRGDPAPDFTLKPAGGGTPVTLSALRGVRPVVLIFGSYT